MLRKLGEVFTGKDTDKDSDLLDKARKMKALFLAIDSCSDKKKKKIDKKNPAGNGFVDLLPEMGRFYLH